MTDITTQARLRSDAVADRPSSVAATIIALTLALMVRWPYFGVSGPDDGFFSEVALLWRQGLLPYLTTFDIKPPGIFAVFAAAQGIFGSELVALRVVGTLADAATMSLMLGLAWRVGAAGAGLFAILLFAWFSHAMVGDDCYSVLIALTTLSMSLAMSDRPQIRKALVSGLAIGAAGLIKQIAAFEGMAILAILTMDRQAAGRRLRTAIVFCLAAATPALVCALYFAVHGGLTALVTDTIVIALRRPNAGSDNVSFLDGLMRFALYGRGIAPILLIALATVFFTRALPRWRREVAAFGLWLTASLAGLIAQHALLATYFGPILPPMLLLTGFGLSIRLGPMSIVMRGGLVALAGLVFAVSLYTAATVKRDDMAAIDSIAASIRDRPSAPDDRLYVIGASPKSVWIYVRAGLRPATAFLIPSQQACPFPNVGPARIDEAFASHPRFVVTDAMEKGYPCQIAGVTETIRSALARDYRLIRRADGIDENYNLYERTDRVPQ